MALAKQAAVAEDNTDVTALPMTARARISWLAHLFKACVKQYHQELIPALTHLIPEDGVVLDVGAHAGQFAKQFARLAPRGHVYSFEPGSYALSILRIAVRLNRLGNVTVLGMGLGEEPGELKLSIPVKSSGSYGFGLAHMGAAGEEEGGRRLVSQSVPITTLDLFAEQRGLDRVDFIKADIEGWELRLLKGGSRMLERFRPTLLLEVNPAALSRAGDTPDALFDYLNGFGYRAFTLSPDMQSFVPAAPGPADDTFFVRPEIAERLPLA